MGSSERYCGNVASSSRVVARLARCPDVPAKPMIPSPAPVPTPAPCPDRAMVSDSLDARLFAASLRLRAGISTCASAADGSDGVQASSRTARR